MGSPNIDSPTWDRVEIWDMPPAQWMTELDTGLLMKKNGTGVIVPEDGSGSTLELPSDRNLCGNGIRIKTSAP
jgi:hypothetical protein